MRKRAVLAAVLLPLIASVAVTVPGTSAATGTQAQCDSLAAPHVPGARVLSVAGVERHDYTVPPDPYNPEPIPGMPPFCDVTVKLTHPGADDVVTVTLWLPLDTWNGRFQGTGGGGFAAGFFGRALAPALVDGYAAASTDAGVPGAAADPGAWASDPELVRNFASRSLHDMAVAGKALTTAFYGRSASYSYWNGCSGGGRQGMMSAQRYPADYDGIVAAAPAINWTKVMPAGQWPQVAMNDLGTYPPPCKLEAFRAAAVAACDKLDKVSDGVISSPASCHFDPRRLVGTTVLCDGRTVTITRADAAVVAQIWRGSGVWPGLPKGASFAGLAGTTDDGTAGIPFYVSDNWIKHFLVRDPNFDTSTLTRRQWYRLNSQSQREYGSVLDTSDADLSAFKRAGGKLLSWHGEADEIISPRGTENYYQRVDRAVPGHNQDFYRLFLAPGVGHCGGGAGPAPTDPLAAIVAWVERDDAPDTLPAKNETSTRDLCPYPLVSRYDGEGNPDHAASHRCARSY